ncbi:MAG: GntR family transcriptional regulator [Planktomarina sp.]|nr:GntR family transcriptional regulator [Planktomarina sp.]
MTNLLNISKKNTLRISDSVYDTIKSAIITHDLPPGYHLSVPSLAKQMGVSRSPIRESVQKLISEGLAYEKPRQGAYVSKFETKDLLPAFQVRLVLDGLAAKLSAVHVTKKLISKLEKIMLAHRNAIDNRDPDKYTNADIQFHTALLDNSNNPLLKEMAKSVYYQIYAAMKTRAAPLGPEVTYQDHMLIFNAVVNAREVEAEIAARDHVEHIIARVLEISEEDT